jgi:hypothetical protein
MSDIVCVVECPEGFNDFSIVKDSVKPGGRIEVTPSQFEQMKQSTPTVVLVDKRIPLDSPAAKVLAEEQAEKDRVKAEIVAKHAKDAPPRRKKKSRGANRIPNPEHGVSPAEMVNLPVTKVKADE